MNILWKCEAYILIRPEVIHCLVNLQKRDNSLYIIHYIFRSFTENQVSNFGCRVSIDYYKKARLLYLSFRQMAIRSSGKKVVLPSEGLLRDPTVNNFVPPYRYYLFCILFTSLHIFTECTSRSPKQFLRIVCKNIHQNGSYSKKLKTTVGCLPKKRGIGQFTNLVHASSRSHYKN